MSCRGVTVLKFVGTVSLGLLTGLSFSLVTVTVPTLLSLPSARTASNAFQSLGHAASTSLRALSGVATSSFLLAFVLSPRTVRHPYLLYTSLLVLGGRLLTSDRLAPLFFSSTPPSSSASAPASPATSPTRPSSSQSATGQHEPHAIHPMEASYEVLGAHSSGGSVWDDGGASDTDPVAPSVAGSAAGAAGSAAGGAAAAPSNVNGEEVRAAVEIFLKKQVLRTALSGVAFAMAIIGLWGDGSRSVPPPVWGRDVYMSV